MIRNVQQLREAPDSELIDEHDKLAETTVAGVSYYLDELRRRETAAAMASSNRVARASLLLSAMNGIVAIVAVVIAVVVR